MLVVAALGGNALLRRGQAMTAGNQRANAQVAARALADIVHEGHRLVITHGNGPQVGLLALQNLAYRPAEAYPLDVLGSETEGMIGYLIGQELLNTLSPAARVATL
jgi:carbamate kinase